MKRIVLAGLVLGMAAGGAVALAAQRADSRLAVGMNATVANQKVDAQLHRVLSNLLEQQRRTRPVRWAGR